MIAHYGVPFGYRDFLRWGLENLDSVPQLIKLVTSLGSSRDVAENWEIIKQIGDLLVTSIAPPDSSFSPFYTEDVDKLEAELTEKLSVNGVSVQAWDGARLHKIWIALQPILPILLQLLVR